MIRKWGLDAHKAVIAREGQEEDCREEESGPWSLKEGWELPKQGRRREEGEKRVDKNMVAGMDSRNQQQTYEVGGRVKGCGVPGSGLIMKGLTCHIWNLNFSWSNCESLREDKQDSDWLFKKTLNFVKQPFCDFHLFIHVHIYDTYV